MTALAYLWLPVLVSALVCIPLMFILIGFLLLPMISIGSLVFSIQATMAANRGQWYRYPISMRLVKPT